MRNPTNHSFNQLLNATTADEIIPALIQCRWEAAGNEGKSPHLTTSKLWYALPSELDYFANIRGALDGEWERWQSMAYSYLFQCFRAIGLDVQAIPIEQWHIMSDIERNQAVYFVWENDALLFSETPDWIKEILSRDSFTRVADITAEVKRVFTDKYTETQRQCAHFEQLYINLSSLIHYVTQHFTRRIPEHIPEHMRPTTDEERKEVYLLLMNEKLERIHSFWKFCYKKKNSLSHPLVPFIRAWLTEQTAKHINKEYDRTHTVAVLRSGSLGSIRDVVLDMDGAGQSPVIIPNSEQIQASQLTLWEAENDSILPDYLPYHILWDGRSKKTTKSGAVSHGVRIADEAFFPLEKGETKVELKFDLGMLLRAFHPDLKEVQISDNRGKYLKYIINGLHEVQYLGWECTTEGGTGLWVPVKMPNNFMPSIRSADDFAVRMTVTLPESPTYNGLMAEKYPLRLTGKRSLLQRNALRTSYWIFDHFGTVNGALRNPTRPAAVWDDDGNLLNKAGKKIFERGKPIKEPYHPRAVKELGREDDEDAIKQYPPLSSADLLKACYPLGYPQGEKAKYLKRAKAAWEALEKEDFIRIDWSPDGWRIMPSDRHLQAHRGLRKAIEESKKKS